jgi:hypothetical protein
LTDEDLARLLKKAGLKIALPSGGVIGDFRTILNWSAIENYEVTEQPVLLLKLESPELPETKEGQVIPVYEWTLDA